MSINQYAKFIVRQILAVINATDYDDKPSVKRSCELRELLVQQLIFAFQVVYPWSIGRQIVMTVNDSCIAVTVQSTKLNAYNAISFIEVLHNAGMKVTLSKRDGLYTVTGYAEA